MTTFIDLFAGLGAFRLGLESQRATCVLSRDFDRKVSQLYQYMHNDDCYGDINELDPDAMPDFDILCAGFPCQPFSVSGTRLLFDDPRSQAALHTFDIISKRKPRAFILENVKGIATAPKGETKSPLDIIEARFRNEGYTVTSACLNAYDHGGCAQNRERFFIVGMLGEHAPFNFPQAVDTSLVHFKNILEPFIDIDSKHYVTNVTILERLNAFKQQHVDFSEYVYQQPKHMRRHTVAGRSPTLTKNMGTGAITCLLYMIHA